MNAVPAGFFGKKETCISRYGLDLNLEGIKAWMFGKKKPVENKDSWTFILPEYLEPILNEYIKRFEVDYNSPAEIKKTFDAILEEYFGLTVVKEEFSKIERLPELQFWKFFYSEAANNAIELKELTGDIVQIIESAREEYPEENALQSIWIDFFEEVRDSIGKITERIREFKNVALYRATMNNKRKFLCQIRNMSLICLGVIPVVVKVMNQFEKLQKGESISEHEKAALMRQMALFDMIVGRMGLLDKSSTSLDRPYHRRSFRDRGLDPLTTILLS
jgi:hypothetical protein